MEGYTKMNGRMVKLAISTRGKGNFLYVVTKNDSDNFQGYWLANSDADMRKQLVDDYWDEDDEDWDEAAEEIDSSYYYSLVGEVQ